MKLQLVSYKTTENGNWQLGAACVEDFDMHSVEYILNTEGNKVKKIYDYQLHTGGPYAHNCYLCVTPSS